MINQHDSIHIYKILDTTSGEYTFFLSAYDTLTKINPKLDHEISLNSFTNIKIGVFYLIIVAMNEKSIPER